MKTAVVTNARQYAGPAAVRSLLAAGMNVVAHDIRFVDAAMREQYEEAHPGVNICQEQEPESLIAAALALNSRVDVLVSNDVIGAPNSPFDTVTADDYRRFFELGMLWPSRLAKAVAPNMRTRRSGAIIFITSAAADHPMGGALLYSSVRAGATVLATALAKELGADNIQVNSIGPAWFDFPRRDDERAQFVELAGKRTALGRMGREDEMGALIAFLASQVAMPLTGQFLKFTAGAVP
jgi:3-oxoacyl-[acyl-carrier protein] reductase